MGTLVIKRLKVGTTTLFILFVHQYIFLNTFQTLVVIQPRNLILGQKFPPENLERIQDPSYI